MTLSRYIAFNFAKGSGVVMLLLLALFSFLSLAEALEEVGTGTYTTTDAISVVLVTTPQRVIELLPVAVLLGSVIGLGAMANQRELVAMRACGISNWRLARTLAAIAAAVSLVALLVMFFIVPTAERYAQEFRAKTLERTALGGTEFWSLQDDRIIRVGSVEYGRIPTDIEIFELADNGRLSRLLRAERAMILGAEQWQLENVSEQRLTADNVFIRHHPQLNWASFLTPDQVSTLVAPAHALSALDLYRYLKESADSAIDTREYQALLWRQLSLPVTVFAMILLGLPLVVNSVRSRSAGYRMIIGGAIGVSFYLFEQVTGHLAVLFELPPASTALAPGLLVLVFALGAVHLSR